jgi:hypothetical protein
VALLNKALQHRVKERKLATCADKPLDLDEENDEKIAVVGIER